jgi:hypothetical protein
MSDIQNAFLSFLSQHDDADWKKVVNELQWAIHPVDQRATRIWFAFFPIKLNRALADSSDCEETAKRLLLKGRYRLADQVDSSAELGTDGNLQIGQQIVHRQLPRTDARLFVQSHKWAGRDAGRSAVERVGRQTGRKREERRRLNDN